MNENKEIIVKPKTSKVVISLLIILIIMVICLSGYIVYYKIIAKDDIKTNEEIKNNIEEKVSEKNDIKSLNGNTYYLYLSNQLYFKFINDTEYEYSINFFTSEPLKSKGKYTYDGKNIKLSDEKISVVLEGDLLFVHNKDYKISDDTEYYDIYFNKDVIVDEFSNIGDAAATSRINDWNSKNSTKMTKTEGIVDYCYGYDTNPNSINCSVTIRQYFDKYDRYTCESDLTSDYFKSTISSGRCDDSYTHDWYFTSVNRNSNGYTTEGSWTGI